ncbi:MAG: hypothetical protein ACXW36_05330, partial [Nitrospira sp.]
KSGWFEGYWDLPVKNSFSDNGTIAFSGKGMPPAQGYDIPSLHEDDANYQIVATPSWATTVHVTNKATSGFTLNFGTPAPNAYQSVSWLLFWP